MLHIYARGCELNGEIVLAFAVNRKLGAFVSAFDHQRAQLLKLHVGRGRAVNGCNNVSGFKAGFACGRVFVYVQYLRALLRGLAQQHAYAVVRAAYAGKILLIFFIRKILGIRVVKLAYHAAGRRGYKRFARGCVVIIIALYVAYYFVKRQYVRKGGVFIG